MSIKVGMVGATGMVGETFFSLMEQRDFPFSEIRAFASEKSVGKTISISGQTFPIETLSEGCFDGLDVVFFSSGDDISLEWAPKAVAAGAFAIDNSAAFRMNPNYPLVVPEINAHQIPDRSQPRIIANPNCSTIQLVMALAPLKEWGLKEVRVSTYQAVSGAGKAAQQELKAQVEQLAKDPSHKPHAENFAHPIAYNCLPHIGSFNELGFCSEEMKIMKETRKILEMPQLKTSAFTVRVPALNGHAEAAWVTLDQEVSQ
ncbi:MAG: aspartate-semialdehyde dehydrogenase, partial [Bdellovibrionales bacterium]|nr:aspartate-semialdehyde dehydrogenase [Bdellovibrionales bacterium]